MALFLVCNCDAGERPVRQRGHFVVRKSRARYPFDSGHVRSIPSFVAGSATPSNV